VFTWRMSAAEAPDPKPSRASGLLSLVRRLIDYGRQVAITLRTNPYPFSTSDIALILARITRGLLLAEALEVRIIRTAARIDAEPAPPRAASHRQPPPAPAPGLDPGVDPEISLPTPEQIAAWVRRRPIGAVIADICRDLGVMPSHPLWRELQIVVIRHGGSLARLVKDILDRAFQLPASPWPLTRFPTPALQSLPPSGADPP
jgi:hypothetical protein